MLIEGNVTLVKHWPPRQVLPKQTLMFISCQPYQQILHQKESDW